LIQTDRIAKKLHLEMKKILEKRTDVAFFLKLTLIRKNPELEKKSRANRV